MHAVGGKMEKNVDRGRETRRERSAALRYWGTALLAYLCLI
jgi:hypothetical protein